jgi:hypothetical protein
VYIFFLLGVVSVASEISLGGGITLEQLVPFFLLALNYWLIKKDKELFEKAGLKPIYAEYHDMKIALFPILYWYKRVGSLKNGLLISFSLIARLYGVALIIAGIGGAIKFKGGAEMAVALATVAYGIYLVRGGSFVIY